MEDRISTDKVARRLGGGLSPQDARRVVRQILASSPKLAASPDLVQPARQGVFSKEGSERYDEAFRRTERRLSEAHERVQKDRHLAASQWSALERHPPARRLIMVRNDDRLHHWGLYDLLVEHARELGSRDPAAAAGLAELALAVAERLDPPAYGAERVADFKTGALVVLGNARRLAGDLAGARLAFSQARIHLELGTGDPLEEAAFLAGLVSLLCDLGEFAKAARSLERASALYRRLGDAPLAGIRIAPAVDSEEDDESDSDFLHG